MHIFLISPKDAKFDYGASNNTLSAWVADHGRLVYYLKSPTNDSIGVWLVGNPVTPPGQSLPSCVAPLPGARDVAPASRFLSYLGVALLGDLVLAGAWWSIATRRARRI